MSPVYVVRPEVTTLTKPGLVKAVRPSEPVEPTEVATGLAIEATMVAGWTSDTRAVEARPYCYEVSLAIEREREWRSSLSCLCEIEMPSP